MKKWFSLLLATALFISCAACSQNNDSGQASKLDPAISPSDEMPDTSLEGKLITYCPPTLGDAFLASTAEKVKQYVGEMGMDMQVAEGEFNISVQLQAFENFISMGSDLIICQPVDVGAMEPVVTEARANGVKVMFLADDPTFDCDGYFLSVDTVQGRMVAEMASTWIDTTFPDAADGEIKVAILGINDRPSALDRCNAIKESIESDSRCTVVFEKYSISDTVEAQTAMDECLTMYQDINVILSFDENGCIGANARIMSDAGLDKSKIACFGGNITETGYTLVDQSATDESVVRGLVTFGDGDTYYQDIADAIAQILRDEVPENNAFFARHEAYNTVGYVSTFDPVEYAASYVDKT